MHHMVIDIVIDKMKGCFLFFRNIEKLNILQ